MVRMSGASSRKGSVPEFPGKGTGSGQISCVLSVLACLVLLSGRTTARAADILTLTPQLVEAHYCLEDGGAISLRVSLRIAYKNVGLSPVLLPFFTRVAGYVLVSGEGNLRSRSGKQVMFQNPPTFDSSRLPDPSNPDPTLFQAIPTGGSAQRVFEVPIIIRSLQRPASTLAGDYSLQVSLENWPDSRGDAATFRKRWEAYGLLWANADMTAPVELRIADSPVANRCGGRVD
jgi:hypothetical protein